MANVIIILKAIKIYLVRTNRRLELKRIIDNYYLYLSVSGFSSMNSLLSPFATVKLLQSVFYTHSLMNLQKFYISVKGRKYSHGEYQNC